MGKIKYKCNLLDNKLILFKMKYNNFYLNIIFNYYKE